MNNLMAATLALLVIGTAAARADEAGVHAELRRLEFRVADLERKMRGLGDVARGVE